MSLVGAAHAQLTFEPSEVVKAQVAETVGDQVVVTAEIQSALDAVMDRFKSPEWVAEQSRLRREMGVPLEDLKLKLFFLRSNMKGFNLKFLFKKALWGLFHIFPSVYRVGFIHRLAGGERVALDSKALYEAIAKVTTTGYVLDSSKSPHRMYSVARELESDVKVVLLCRDYRGNVYSKLKRGIGLCAICDPGTVSR